jgi:hypothetical protein
MFREGLGEDDGGAVVRGVREALGNERATGRIERPGRGGIQQIALDVAQLRIRVRIADHRLTDRFPLTVIQRTEQIPLKSAPLFLVVPCQCPTPSPRPARDALLTLSCPFSPKDPAGSGRT